MEHKSAFQAPFGWYDSPEGLVALGMAPNRTVG
jgi:hypothetical protein